MSWVYIEFATAIFVIVIGLTILSAYTTLVCVNRLSIPPKGRAVSRDEFLDALDYFTLSPYEQVMACLQYLGEKDYGIDLAVMHEYSLTEDTGITQPVYPPLLFRSLMVNHSKNTEFLVEALNASIVDGSFTDALTVVEDTIASSLPNYHMRFD